MPKADAGSTKWLNNQMKAKGLQRLRWYCQVCERQMRDANGFKQHTLSESHVRQMQIVGQSANKYINDYSNQFKNDFLLLLRTSHGEKKININHFYQEYIANKEHVHMNATKWPSLTEFAKFLGREGLCRVEEGERGLEISWIDNSPETLRRQDAIRKKERQDKGDEERELKLIEEQIKRARSDVETRAPINQENANNALKTELRREDEGKISLNISTRQLVGSTPSDPVISKTLPPDGVTTSLQEPNKEPSMLPHPQNDCIEADSSSSVPEPKAQENKVNPLLKAKRKNIFADAAKRQVASKSIGGTSKAGQVKHMSEAERIMREELDQKRRRESDNTFSARKRARA